MLTNEVLNVNKKCLKPFDEFTFGINDLTDRTDIRNSRKMHFQTTSG